MRKNNLRFIWRAIYPTFLHMAVQLLVATLLGVLAVWLTVLTSESVGSFFSTSLIMLLSSGASILIFRYLFSREKDSHNEISSKPRWYLLPLAFLLGMGLNYAVGVLIALFNLEAIFPSHEEAIEQILDGTLLLQQISIGTLTPIAEEYCFRRLTYGRLRQRLSVIPSVVISAMIFGLVHGNPLQMIYAFIVGCVFALLYEWTGRFVVPCLAHIGFNIYAIMISVLPLDNMVLNTSLSLAMIISLVVPLFIITRHCRR